MARVEHRITFTIFLNHIKVDALGMTKEEMVISIKASSEENCSLLIMTS